MPRLRPAAILLLMLTAAGPGAAPGCHRLLPGSARCSAEGGARWRELRSRHFVVATDLEGADGAKLVAQLERIQALVIKGLVGEQREIPGYVRVLAPASEATYWTLVPRAAVGLFTTDFLGQPTVILHPAALRLDPEVIAHELVHHVAWYFFPRQPRWFGEGLAHFVQTVASETPGYAHAVGVVPGLRADEVRSARRVPVRDLFAWRGWKHEGARLQLWSWVLYHWLWNQRPRQLAELQARLARAEDPAAAWLAAFPELDPADGKAMKRLEAALDEHRRGAELVYYQVTATADATFTEVPLAPADVHMLLAERRGFPLPDAKAALEHDPHHPIALWARDRRDAGALARALRASVEARPGDWRAWLLLGQALDEERDAPERAAALRRAVELNPASATALNDLAWSIVRDGRAAEALPFARRAVELAPSSPHALDTLAAVAADLGACPEALALQHRAVDVAPEPYEAELRERLFGLEARCRDRSPDAPW